MMSVLGFIAANIGTVIAVSILLACIAVVTVVLVLRHKKGESARGCDCAFCNKDCANRK